MRTLVPFIVLFASVAAALDVSASGEKGVSRSAGAFAVFEVSDPDACARRCAEDSLCIAWTFRSSGACELTAIVPAAVAEPGAVSGLSARAPAFARSAPAPAPADHPTQEAEEVVTAAVDEDDASAQLLGAADDASVDLRLRFGQRPRPPVPSPR